MKNNKKPTEYLKRYKYNERIELKSGTFLHTYCPNCNKSLIKDNEIELLAVAGDDTTGVLKLSPYLNVFEHKSDVKIQPETELKDLKCPHCETSIVRPEIKCETCGAKAAELSVAAVHLRVPFFICTKEGCHWHGISPEDEDELIRDSSPDW